MYRTLLSLFLGFTLIFSGCQTAAIKQSKAVSSGIYAIQSSMKAGRFDLAQKYEDQLIKIVAPPKQKIEVKAIIAPSKVFDGSKDNTPKQAVVLPETFQNVPVIVDKSNQFDKIINSDPKLQTQIKEEEKAVGKFSSQVDDARRAEEKATNKPAKKINWFAWIWGTLGITGIIAAIVICVLFPPAIPIVIDIAKGLFSVMEEIFSAIVNGVSSLWKRK